MTLYYEGDSHELYEVELHDVVEASADGLPLEGVIVKIHPKSRTVTIRYEDHHDAYRTSGNPRRKTVRAPVHSVNLIQRDG